MVTWDGPTKVFGATDCVYIDPYDIPTGGFDTAYYRKIDRICQPVDPLKKEKPWHKFTKRRMDGRFAG